MENVVDALYMAAAVLILIIALTVSISSFTSLKTQVEEIVTADDTMDYVTETDEKGNTKYLNYISSNEDVRTVGAESVISSIRRISRESYTIYLVLYDNTEGTNLANNLKDKLTVKDKKDFFVEISQDYKKTNGETIQIINQKAIRISLSDRLGQRLNDDMMEEIYKTIKDKKFKEYQGIYQDNTEVSSANKETYRIITYVETENVEELAT